MSLSTEQQRSERARILFNALAKDLRTTIRSSLPSSDGSKNPVICNDRLLQSDDSLFSSGLRMLSSASLLDTNPSHLNLDICVIRVVRTDHSRMISTTLKLSTRLT